MNKQYKLNTFLAVATVLFAVSTSVAQQDSTKLRKEVEVVKAYQPTVQEAKKINDIPQIKPEQTEAPTFDYSIFSKPVFTTFDPSPVAAAKMVGEPRPELKNGLLKLGVGNYQTPYGELFFNAKPSQKSNFGMHFAHLSSNGNLSLLNDDKVKAPESNNVAELFAERFFRRSSLKANLSFDRNAYSYYGYTGEILTNEQKEQMIPWFGEKQYMSKGTVGLRLKSEILSTSELNYDFGAKYHYLSSRTGQTEGELVLSGKVSKKIDNAIGFLDASLTIYNADSIFNRVSNTYSKKQQTLFRANPSVKWGTENAGLQLGLNVVATFDRDDDAKFIIYPNVKANWSPVPQVLTLFAGVDGYLQHNTWSAIAYENPYVDPYHDVANANYNYVISGGLKGKITPKTNYVAQASYSVIEDQHFYITKAVDYKSSSSTVPVLRNTFDWVYDNMNLLKLSGELLHSVSDNFTLSLAGNYYSYDLSTLQKPWQMQNFDCTVSGVYKPNTQLKFTADIFMVGKRTAMISSTNTLSAGTDPEVFEITMDPIIDMNVGAEYQFSPKLNFFFKLNNFGFQKYEQWLGYTNRSFNGLAGISYIF